MNKYLRNTMSAALISAMALSVFACSSGETEDPVSIGSGQTTISVPADENGKGGSETPAGQDNGSYGFTYQDVRLVVNTNIADALSKLGDPSSYHESDSCAYQGLDKIYTFPFFVIYTYPIDGNDFISSIEVKADTVTTDEGIRIGSSKDDVLKAYGNEYEEQGAVLKYKKGECVLSFVITDNAVSGIVYDYANLKTE